jgi:signal transduction histidine kinase
MPDTQGEQERIVVIDDDYAMRLSCSQTLEKSGFHVEVFADGAHGLAGVAESRPALVVVDLKMPGLSGLDVIERVHALDPDVVVVVITGYATIITAVEAMKSGAYDFLPKPFMPDELRMIVGRGLEHRRLRRKARELEMTQELMRRRFVTFVSHQLKAPLAAVHQYLEVLERLRDVPEAEAVRREWVQRCLVRTGELRHLVDDWLTLARAEGGCLVSRRQAVELAPILVGLVAAYEERARGAGVAIEADLAAGPLVVTGDHNCLMVLFDNLLTNAIAYNRRGGRVAIAAREEAGEVVVEVLDTGVGIPEESLGLLFEEFYRVVRDDIPDEERVGGTGLGLPICRRIVSELGGGIEVESEVGVGSTFRVRLPVAAPPPDASPCGAGDGDAKEPAEQAT